MSNEIIIAPVPIPLVNFMWSKCEPALTKAIRLAEDEVSLDALKNKIMRGEQGLFAILDGEEVITCAVTEMHTFETGLKVLIISVLGGSRMNEWDDRFMNLMQLLAKQAGCTKIRGLSVRKGWGRFLKKYKFKHCTTILECEVKP